MLAFYLSGAYVVISSKPYGRPFRKGGNGRFDRDGRQGKGGGGKGGGFRGGNSGGGGKNQMGWYKVTVRITIGTTDLVHICT